MQRQQNIITQTRSAICKALKTEDSQLHGETRLLESGLDSMFMMKLLNSLRQQGCKVSLKEIYQATSWQLLEQLICSRLELADATDPVDEQCRWPVMTDGKPFPLTPVQHAYFIGRGEHQPLGGNACHLYQEFDGEQLSAGQLNAAISQLVGRHPMLNVAFAADGTQCWQANPVWSGVRVHDFADLSDADRQHALQELRQQLSHRVLNIESGQTFDVQLSLLGNGCHRIHVNIDLVIMDASGFSLFFNELSDLLRGNILPALATDYDFCSYLVQEQGVLNDSRESAEAFWRQQLEDLPPAPALPLSTDPGLVTRPAFVRRRLELQSSEWQQFQAYANGLGVTPTMVLAALYGEVLARWSGLPRVLLNLTVFDCHPFNEAVSQMLADFTNIVLLDYAVSEADLISAVRRLQARFTEVYEHRGMSGVEVLRELRKQGSHPHGCPVVFTSNLNQSLYGDDLNGPLGVPGWGSSQTPQVWIDFVAFKHGDGVILQWDSVDQIFPDDLVATMFTAFSHLVTRLLTSQQHWQLPLPDLLPVDQKAVRDEINSCREKLPQGLLHQRIFNHAECCPDAPALLSEHLDLTFAELTLAARRLAADLVTCGLKPGGNVAVSMDKGAGQTVAVLGILYAGGVYVPVPPDQPLARRSAIYDSAEIDIVIRCEMSHGQYEWHPDKTYVFWQSDTQPLSVQQGGADPLAPAYIIFTSGSTGTPKGVVVSHQAALNTCMDINQRHGVAHHDRMLALSALHFDLSVYDIFGVLSVGGALVVPQQTQLRDPMAWERLLVHHGVTLWNTVPALFDMLLTFCEGMGLPGPGLLRTVMLSGDWISLSLPARYRAFNKAGRFSAMGGATEAAIWSNECMVDEVLPHWPSVPYGYPLSNQAYRVVDESGRDCPDWVAGELWIGGAGVALGYCNDAEKTAAHFIGVSEGAYAGRWYRTGDMGRYWPDGMLEFLGRRDNQVKVGGYRIELGEIDAALNRLAGVKNGVTLALGNGNGADKYLESFIVPEGAGLMNQVMPDSRLSDSYRALFDVAERFPGGNRDQEAAALANYIGLHLQRYCAEPGISKPVKAWESDYQLAGPFSEVFADWFELLERQGMACRVAGRHQLAEYALSLPAEPQACFEVDEHSDRQLAAVMRGTVPPPVLLDTAFSPEAQLFADIDNSLCIQTIVLAIAELSVQLQRPVRVVEVDARSGICAAHIATLLSPQQISYTALDGSLAMVQKATQRLQRFSHAEAIHGSDAWPADLHHCADVILLNNCLHRHEDIDARLKVVAELAAPQAMLAVLEIQTLLPQVLISARLLEMSVPVLLSQSTLLDSFTREGLGLELQWQTGSQFGFILRFQDPVYRGDAGQAAEALAQFLPGYMVPRRFTFMDSLPLTLNGKVDRKALAESVRPEILLSDQPVRLPETAAECAVAEVWQVLFGSGPFQRDSDFFLLGGDSLMATRCVGELAGRGYHAELTDVFSYPQLSGFAARLSDAAQCCTQTSVLVSDRDGLHQPFPLTAVQQAYWIGRQPGFALGEVSSQFFIEFQVENLDTQRFNRAMDRLIAQHDMLRAVVRNHQQQILNAVPAFNLPLHQVADVTGAEAEQLRDRLSHQVRDPAIWPVFDIQACADGQGNARLFVCLDNMLLDGLSMQIFLSDLETLYLHPDGKLPALEISFRDYVCSVSEPEQAESRRYWLQQLTDLPPVPQLPLQADPDHLRKAAFIRVAGELNPADWQALRGLTARHQLTPSVVLMGAYAATLAVWSRQSDVTLNLTLFDRRDVHPQIGQILGDFTSLSLLAWRQEDTWLASIQRLQQQLAEDLRYQDVSAVWVMRELARLQSTASASMPVVFTSALGIGSGSFLSDSGWLKPVWGISQTPQVWLDHQVYESDGKLCFNWDAVEALLPKPVLEPMFDDYCQLLNTLIRHPERWGLPLGQLTGTPTVVDKATVPQSVLPDGGAVACPGQADAAVVRTICEQFRETVSLSLSETDNFFDAGANSLQLVQLHGKLLAQGMPLVVTDLFTYPSALSLAEYLGGIAVPQVADGQQQVFQQRRKAGRRRNSL
ncbi:non-ribosomal peptide synthetase [Aliamphritea hakodatensis]|uniref:non-ribosomal peptide synthetase n=1 Tax=Aliamphritea hakodatensis TaxID=2895352 RepID=UPI0022FD8147|nr:non-ribosomal peptide synthetase [Aliamphritea hakodatensis]